MTSQNGLETNGLSGNGIYVNGIRLNGIRLNGIRLNGIRLNGIDLNGIRLNGIRLNGVSANGIRLNGASLNGINLNGIRLNGIRLNGIRLNGIRLNGIRLNGIRLNGLELADATIDGVAATAAEDTTIAALVEGLVMCALPSGQSAQVTLAGGSVVTFNGMHGYAPEWRDGDLGGGSDEQVSACLQGIVDLDAAVTLAADEIELSDDEQEMMKKVVRYMVECALEPGHFATIDGDTYEGALGLAPEWETDGLTAVGERRVSACLAARTNPLTKTVQLSLRGEGIDVSAFERTQYSRHEGAFWGNLFSDTPTLHSCKVNGGGISGRVCTDPEGCGFVQEGACATACATQTGEGLYTDCAGADEVLNTFLPIRAQVGLSNRVSCAIRPDTTTWCWGSVGIYYQSPDVPLMGDGISGPHFQEKPVQVAGATGAAEVDLSEYHGCVRKQDGSVWCWGDNGWGQLGHPVGTPSVATTPLQVTALGTDVVDLIAYTHGSCAVKADGSVWCWGFHHGSTPVQVLDSAVSITTNTGEFFCGLRNDARLWCWGNNSWGQLGRGSAGSPDYTPAIATVAGDGVVDACAGSRHACALDADGTVRCWGWNHHGQADPTKPLYTETPVLTGATIYLPGPAESIRCGQMLTCAVLEGDGTVRCWGQGGGAIIGPAGGVGARELFMRIRGVEAAFAREDGTLWNFNTSMGDPAMMEAHPCGDGFCDPGIGEDEDVCSADCDGGPNACGDDTCSAGAGETCLTCTADCGPPTTTWHVDADGDGYGNWTYKHHACATPPAGYAAPSSDCNDANAAIRPDAAEPCDLVDNDCDGTVDDGHPIYTWYSDSDNDGYGSSYYQQQTCMQPANYVAQAGDCNGSTSSVAPGATETCNAIDDDCNGVLDDAGGCGCGHAESVVGLALSSQCSWCATDVCAIDPYCCTKNWDASCVQLAVSTCQGSEGCYHAATVPGVALDYGCSSCATTVCDNDWYCCSEAWDSACMELAASLCGQVAADPWVLTSGVPVTGLAGSYGAETHYYIDVPPDTWTLEVNLIGAEAGSVTLYIGYEGQWWYVMYSEEMQNWFGVGEGRWELWLVAESGDYGGVSLTATAY